jgi:Raf kinase inhibitor-like YbhB/YbcL family protein
MLIRPLAILVSLTLLGCHGYTSTTLALADKPASGEASGKAVTIDQLEVKQKLDVTSTAFSDGESIPAKHSAYKQDISPPLAWTGVPRDAKTIVILVEDPDATTPKPFVHWVLYNLPADQSSLPAAVPAQARLTEFGKPEQGRNTYGSIGYYGPKPPKGDSPHHYHFQVFALDARLDLLPGRSRDEIVNAMKPHLLAAGRIIGTFAKPE